MALIDRLDPDNENRTLSFHEFSAAISKVADGDWTLAEFKTRLELDANDDVQLNKLIVHFQGLSQADQRKFHTLVEREGVLWETGRQTNAEFLASLGMT